MRFKCVHDTKDCKLVWWDKFTREGKCIIHDRVDIVIENSQTH